MQTTGSIYIHVPLCKRKCNYCHFYSVPYKEELSDLLVSYLLKEWQNKRHLLQKAVSIYFGGGTPTLLGSKNVEKIVNAIQKNLKIDSSCEITIETNPEDVTYDLIDSLQKIGINRISMGVQSFDDQLLKILGRRHSADDAIKAIETIASSISNLSIDLMYDIPHQTLKMFQQSVNTAVSLPITHLSLYNLTLEKNSLFYRDKKKIIPHMPEEEISIEMLKYAIKTLENAAFKRYEISAFAKNNKVSVHNLGYWQARPFLGLGPAAFSYFENKRFCNVPDIDRYIKAIEEGKDPCDFSELLTDEAHIRELLTINLRVIDGVDMEKFEKDHGKISKELWNVLKDLEKKGLILLEKNICKLSERGLMFYDTVAEEII